MKYQYIKFNQQKRRYVPTMNQAPKALDPCFPKMQLHRVLSVDPTCLVNTDIFQTPHPQFGAQALCTVCSPQARYTVDVISVILFRLDKAPSRATKDIIQQFSLLMTNRLILMCKITSTLEYMYLPTTGCDITIHVV